MGRIFARDLASGEFGLDLDRAVSIHLSANHYPPVPQSFVPVCIKAIEHGIAEEWDARVKLPEGTTWRGEPTAPASAIIEGFHLGEFLGQYDNEV